MISPAATSLGHRVSPPPWRKGIITTNHDLHFNTSIHDSERSLLNVLCPAPKLDSDLLHRRPQRTPWKSRICFSRRTELKNPEVRPLGRVKRLLNSLPQSPRPLNYQPISSALLQPVPVYFQDLQDIGGSAGSLTVPYLRVYPRYQRWGQSKAYELSGLGSPNCFRHVATDVSRYSYSN